MSWLGDWWDRLTSTDNKGTANVTGNKQLEQEVLNEPTMGGMHNTTSGSTMVEPAKPPKEPKEHKEPKEPKEPKG